MTLIGRLATALRTLLLIASNFKKNYVLNAYLLIILGVLFRVILATSIGNCFSFQPDEENYLHNFLRLHGENFQAYKYTSFGTFLPGVLKVLYFPAWLFNFLGVDPILSIRLNSIFYFGLSALSLLQTIELIRSNKYQNSSNKIFKEDLFIIFLYISIPSQIIWTTLGVRESMILCTISFLLFFLVKIIYFRLNFSRFVCFILCLLLICYLKLYLGILILIFIMTAILWSKSKSSFIKLRISPLPLLVIFLLGPLLVASFLPKDLAQNSISKERSYGISSGSSSSNASTGEERQIATIASACKKIALPGFSKFPRIDVERLSPGLGSTTKAEIETNSNSIIGFLPQNTTKLFKPIIYLPVNFLVFLFAPLNPFSAQNIAIKMACIENILLLFSLISLIRRFRSVGVPTVRGHETFVAYLLVAVIGYVAFMSQIETNVGTAFRHKVLIYYPLLLVIALLHSTDYKSGQTRSD